MQHVVLTKSELDRMDAEVSAEIAAALGDVPTLDALTASGDIRESTTIRVLDAIDNFGRVVTLFVAEFVQSVAALVIAAVFAVLEYQRVYHGSMALGQTSDGSQWIAVAVVCANFIVPIYVLKALRGSDTRTITKNTAKSVLLGLWQRLTGDAEAVAVSWSYNPTLKASKVLITYTTIVLAVYDLLAPIITSILEGTAEKPMLILTVELLMGLGLSIAGVFFLQSAAHEIGLRMLSDRPMSAADVLRTRRAEYEDRAASIRADVRARYEAAKLDTLNAKRAERMTSAAVTPSPVQTAPPTTVQTSHAADLEDGDTAPMVTSAVNFSTPPSGYHNGNGNGHK